MEESQNTEFKLSWHDEYLKWICGFANAKGGKLLIGIDDAGKPVGVENAKKLLEDIPNKIRDTMGIVADVSYNPLGLAPKFYSAVGCFVVTLPNLNGNVARSDTQGDAKAQKRNVDLMLVEWIAADPKVTVKVLAERLKCSVVTVKRHIAKLQNIRYVGHGYSGHWEVV